MQQVVLTVLLGPEDPTAWARLRAAERQTSEKHLAAARAWKKANPERNRAATSAWKKANIERNRAAKRVRHRHLFDTDPAYRLLTNLRPRIRIALKTKAKATRTLDLLGCTILELRAYLEALFVPGMTWENYGPVWHVDHKRPCTSFDFSDPVQQRECFHFTNLQPLFAEDNLRKGDTWQ